MNLSKNLSIILPAKNEANSLKFLIPHLNQCYPEAEIIVVNDGSTDDTIAVLKNYPVKLITHPYSLGNGAAIKNGARASSNDILIFMDADGQHLVADIEPMLEKFHQGYEMVVGSRDKAGQANLMRWLGNRFYSGLASYIVGQSIKDLTSGFRIVDARKFKAFLYLLPNGFSYPTTITMAFFRVGFTVGYVPIKTEERIGKSHIRIIKDGIKFLLIIYKMTILYSPLKVFFPFVLLHLIAAVSTYLYSYFTGSFNHLSAIFASAAVIIFVIGLMCEQITTLMYASSNSQSAVIDKECV